ncbi:glycosyltransferase family 2 protein [Desulfofustis limnaeus]|uniref:Glycosyl transferase n=1 Tax=Desulfofustis limnaeus TaxID=2740163 RepID=A0ABM7W9Q2_9BACT|nr:glycosyltransferase family 2 protein [Desulfofustis limnaeus]BDD87659.1 glycosyl transferase [Desulfofustis limnaeus]
MEKLPITVILAAKNEAANLPRCFSALGPVAHVVLLDSHSTDDTAEIARRWGAEVLQFDYKGGYPKKRQWALDTLPIDTPWVLLLDADEVIPEKLWCEIAEVITEKSKYDAFMVTKGFHFLGRRMVYGGFSHSAILLFKTGKASFERIFDDDPSGLDMEVHERVMVDGTIGRLTTPLIHEDFKGLEAYISRHNKYSTWEARLRYLYLTTGSYGRETITPKLFGNSQERRRALKKLVVRLPFEPWLWFWYHYFFKLGFLEGREGLIACRIRASYINQVRAKIYELKLKGSGF